MEDTDHGNVDNPTFPWVIFMRELCYAAVRTAGTAHFATQKHQSK